jgi:two-component system, cell cycle response regulator DivK
VDIRILVVEDDPETLDMITIMLERRGYSVVVASNGMQGLILAEAEMPDLIITDIRMPQIDGVEMIKRLRARESTKQTPILGITAYEMEYATDAVKTGANRIMAKPFTDDMLVAYVRALLSGGSSSGSGGSGRGGPFLAASDGEQFT